MADISDWVCNLANFLQSQGVGGLNLSMWVGAYPDDKREGVLIIPTGGFISLKVPSTARPTAQITCRSAKHCTAFDKATQIYDLLNEGPQRVYNSGTRALYSKALQPPFQVSKRDNFFNIVCNYQFWLT